MQALVVFGFSGLLTIVFVVTPVVLLARRFSDGRLRPAGAAVIGALLSPLCLFPVWFLFHEQDETFFGLFRFWIRVPGEFVFGVLPHTVASAAWSYWIVRRRRRNVGRAFRPGAYHALRQ